MSQAEAAPEFIVERDRRRIHVLFGGHSVAESTDAIVLREPGQPPAWYFPRQDVEMLVLHATAPGAASTSKGPATYFTIYRDASVIERAAWSFEHPAARFQAIAGRIAFDSAHFDLAAHGHTPAEWTADHALARPDPTLANATTFPSIQDLAEALRRAAAAHERHEARIAAADRNWPDWYAAYMAAEQAGQDLPS